MFKLMLNVRKPNNYAFFCPVSRLHLTLRNPAGFANGVTPVILRALRANTLIDVDNVIDLETGTVKNVEEPNNGQQSPGTPEQIGSISEDTHPVEDPTIEIPEEEIPETEIPEQLEQSEEIAPTSEEELNNKANKRSKRSKN